MKRILFFVILLGIHLNLYSQVFPELDWFRIYNGPVSSFDYLHSLGMDNSGIYLAGGSYMFDSTADAFLIKYSLEGDSLLSIVYSLQPDVRDEFNSLVVDANSDLYLTGETRVNSNNRKMILQKYSPSGQLIWSNDFNFRARGLALILDDEELPILAYDNWEGPAFAHLVINKFNSLGDSLWAVVFRDDTSAYGLADVTIDNDNFIYVGILQLQIINGQHIFHSYIACIQDGNLIWFRSVEGSRIRKLFLDSDNNLLAFTQDDSRIYKINSSTGETLWEKNVNNSLYHISNLYFMCVDQLNNIFVTGTDGSTNTKLQIKKLSPIGEELWLSEYTNQEELDYNPNALVSDLNNDIYITGVSVDSIFRSYVIKLSTEGELLWKYYFNEIPYEHLSLWFVIVQDSSLFIGGTLSDVITMSNIFIMKLDQKLSSGVKEIKTISNFYELNQNYPNPFNPHTKIKFTIPSRTEYYSVPQLVTLKVYDVLGNEIATLVNEERPAGEYEVEFDASALPSGIYFYQLKASQFIQTKKMVLLK